MIKKSSKVMSGTGLATVVGLIGVILISFFVVQEHQTHNPHFDVYDEGAHFDYVDKLKSGQVPSWDSTYSQTTMLIADCLGSIFAEGQSCETKVRVPGSFPPNGFSYQAQQPPLGYLQYLAVPQISGLSPLEKLNKTRDYGLVVVLFFYALLFNYLYRAFSLQLFGATMLALLILLNPIQIHALSIVTNDSTSVLGGLIIILVVANLFNQVKISKIFLSGIGITMGLMKGLLLVLPFSFFVLALLFKHIRSDKAEASPQDILFILNLRRSMLVILQFGVLSNFAFLFYQGMRSTTSSEQVFGALLGFSQPVSVFQFDTLLQSFVNIFSSFSGNWFGNPFENNIFSLVGFTVTGVLGFVISREKRLIRHVNKKLKNPILEYDYAFLAKLLGYSYLISSASIAIAWPVIWFLNGNYDFPAPQRYNLVTLPLLATSIVLAFKSKSATRKSSQA